MQYHVQVAHCTCMSAGPWRLLVCAHACLNSLLTFSQGPVELSPVSTAELTHGGADGAQDENLGRLLPIALLWYMSLKSTLHPASTSMVTLSICALWSGMFEPIRCCSLVGAASLRGASL